MHNCAGIERNNGVAQVIGDPALPLDAGYQSCQIRFIERAWFSNPFCALLHLAEVDKMMLT